MKNGRRKWSKKQKLNIILSKILKYNKFRFDCEKIRKDLIKQKDEEKQKLSDELQKQKQNHLTSTQSQINELEQQVKYFKNNKF